MASLNVKSGITIYNRLFRFVIENMDRRRLFEVARKYSSALKNYEYRNITEADIPKIAEIRKKFKFHDCTSSLYTYHKLDPKAIIIAEDETGHIIGIISMITYAKDLFVAGLVFVHENYRKRNIAKELILKAMARHKGNLMVAYSWEGWAKSLTELWRLRAGFTVEKYFSEENVDSNLLYDNLPEDVAIYPFHDSLLDRICDYDSSVVNYERRKYLELSCLESNSRTMIALKNGKCVGFGSVKLSCSGAKRIGPLYADDPNVAEALLKSLLQMFEEGNGLSIVIPSPNLEAQKLVNKLNLTFKDRLVQLHDKHFTQPNVCKAYAHFDVNSASI